MHAVHCIACSMLHCRRTDWRRSVVRFASLKCRGAPTQYQWFVAVAVDLRCGRRCECDDRDGREHLLAHAELTWRDRSCEPPIRTQLRPPAPTAPFGYSVRTEQCSLQGSCARYAGRKSWPHEEMQCASSIATSTSSRLRSSCAAVAAACNTDPLRCGTQPSTHMLEP